MIVLEKGEVVSCDEPVAIGQNMLRASVSKKHGPTNEEEKPIQPEK